MDHAAIREAGRRIAADSLRDDPLTELDRAIVGSESVQIRIPLRDPGQLKAHLEMLIKTAEQCILLIDRNVLKDRSVLLDVRVRIRMVGQKINHYRKIRSL